MCKLKKGLYGLKQSPRSWHQLMKGKLFEMVFRQSRYDSCLFIYENEEGNTAFIGLYVDDGLVAGNDKNHLHAIIASIQDSFKITVAEDVKKFLGIEITGTETCIQLHQESYILETLKKFNLDKSRGAQVPLNPSLVLEPEKSTYRHDSTVKYQELLGALLFISRFTRPDIAFAVNKLSRYFQCYEEKHMKAAKDVLRYLSTTALLGISFKKNTEVKFLG